MPYEYVFVYTYVCVVLCMHVYELNCKHHNIVTINALIGQML